MQFQKIKTLFGKNKKEEKSRTQKKGKQKKPESGCSHSFGYLSDRPENASVPEECFFCKKLVDCSVKTKTK